MATMREQWAKKWGGCCVPFHGGEQGPHLTQCRLGRGQPPYQVVYWSTEPFASNVTDIQYRQTDNGPIGYGKPFYKWSPKNVIKDRNSVLLSTSHCFQSFDVNKDNSVWSIKRPFTSSLKMILCGKHLHGNRNMFPLPSHHKFPDPQSHTHLHRSIPIPTIIPQDHIPLPHSPLTPKVRGKRYMYSMSCMQFEIQIHNVTVLSNKYHWPHGLYKLFRNN